MRHTYKKLASGLLSILHAVPTYGTSIYGPMPLPAVYGPVLPVAAVYGPLLPTPATDETPFITADHVQAIYGHVVQTHWVHATGLFISFLGTQDNKLSQQSSTYEQAAAGILAVRLGDIPRAQGIFHFLRAAWLEGPLKGGWEGISGLANFYNAEFGGEGIEKTIHMGPNAWAGLFAAYYGNKTGDKQPTTWALNVARWIAHDIPHQDGGVAMGPINGADGVPWRKVYSPENNVSYYDFLGELLRSADVLPSDRAWLIDEQTHVENWLVSTAFDRLAYPMNPGVNPPAPHPTPA